jgi:hypothetical protein
MDFLHVDATSKQTVENSFNRIAEKLFSGYLLQVNASYYRLIDIEFYYLTDNKNEIYNTHKDIYTHKHLEQLYLGKWYFHDSGIDITIGDGLNHYGGILLRGIAKIKNVQSNSNLIDYQVHGPVKVKSTICERFNSAFSNSPNYFRLVENDTITKPTYIIKTRRINLNPQKEGNEVRYYDSKYRYVILLDKCQFGYTSKTQIAKDLKEQYKLSNEEVNKLLGSKFL